MVVRVLFVVFDAIRYQVLLEVILKIPPAQSNLSRTPHAGQTRTPARYREKSIAY